MQNAISNEQPAKIFNFIGQVLKQHPEQRCATIDKCIGEVRKGSSVYIFVCTNILLHLKIICQVIHQKNMYCRMKSSSKT